MKYMNRESDEDLVFIPLNSSGGLINVDTAELVFSLYNGDEVLFTKSAEIIKLIDAFVVPITRADVVGLRGRDYLFTITADGKIIIQDVLRFQPFSTARGNGYVENYDNIISSLNTLDNRIDINDTQISNLDGRINVNNAQISNLDGRIDGLDVQTAFLDGRIDVNDAQISNLDGRINVNDARIATLQSRADGHDADITAINNELDNTYSDS